MEISIDDLTGHGSIILEKSKCFSLQEEWNYNCSKKTCLGLETWNVIQIRDRQWV